MFAYLHFCYFRWIHLFKLWVTANNQTFFKKTRKRHRNQCSITREADPSRINGDFTNRVTKQTSAQYQNDKVHLPFVQSQSLGHNILTNCNETTRATCPLFSFSPPSQTWLFLGVVDTVCTPKLKPMIHGSRGQALVGGPGAVMDSEEWRPNWFNYFFRHLLLLTNERCGFSCQTSLPCM
jgi:hypothetical protein